MTDITTGWTHDTDVSCFRLQGADVRKFLQSKLTRDVKKWNPGEAQYALAVDINGKTLFDGEFVMHSAECVDAWVATPLVERASAHLEKYIILEDVEVSYPDLARWTLWSRSSDDEERELADIDGVSAVADVAESDSGLESYRYPATRGALRGSRFVIGPDDTLNDTFSARTAASSEAISRLEIQLGIPRIERDFFTEKTIPLEAGLTEGIDFNKGCYLGQEVIERLSSRGTPARRLCRVAWVGPEAAPLTELESEGKNAGYVTSCVHEDGETIGLAYIRRKFLEAPENLVVSESTSKVTIISAIGDEVDS